MKPVTARRRFENDVSYDKVFIGKFEAGQGPFGSGDVGPNIPQSSFKSSTLRETLHKRTFAYSLTLSALGDE